MNNELNIAIAALEQLNKDCIASEKEGSTIGKELQFIFISRQYLASTIRENQFIAFGAEDEIEDLLYHFLKNDEVMVMVFSRALMAAIENIKMRQPNAN